MRMERIDVPTCEYGTPDGSRAEGVSACGEVAAYRASWDGGRTWLPLCGYHAAKVEEEEESRIPFPEG